MYTFVVSHFIFGNQIFENQGILEKN